MRSCYLFLITILLVYSTPAQVRSSNGNGNFDAFLKTFEEGINRFINGDPALWKEHVSHNENATILGGWGAYEKGWGEVGSRYEWAAARFQKSGAKVTVEYLSKVVVGDLAYTVTIERSQVLLIGQQKPAAMALRVTHVFHKEAGEWKLLHRHADVLTPRTAPASVLQNDVQTRKVERSK